MTVLSMQELGRRGAATKAARARQRRALRGQPPAVIAAAIVNPPRELAGYTLRQLFGPPGGRGERGVVPGVGESALRRVLRHLAYEDPTNFRRDWNPELRLRELTPRERERLVLALIDAAPPRWKAAA